MAKRQSPAEVKKLYACGTAFYTELGRTKIDVFTSKEELFKRKLCLEECGYVEITVKVVDCKLTEKEKQRERRRRRRKQKATDDAVPDTMRVNGVFYKRRHW